jgi:hypothetical protein
MDGIWLRECTPAATALSGVKLPQSAQGVIERGTSVAER